MKREPSDVALFVYVVAALAGLMLAALALGGCSSVRAARGDAPTEWSAREQVMSQPAAPRGPILIEAHIIDTDPSDDVVLSFVVLCVRIFKVLRGEGVQT